MNTVININAKDVNGNTPLTFASQHNQITIVKVLLEKGADVNAKNSADKTALMIAVNEGDIAIVTLLLKNGADVNATDSSGLTALMYARRIAIVTALIEKGADVNITTSGSNYRQNYRQTALSRAATYAYKREIPAILNKLLDSGADPLPLLFAIAEICTDLPTMKPYTDIVSRLIRNNSAHGEMALLRCIEQGGCRKENHFYTEFLLKSGVDANAPNALNLAIIKGSVKFVELLLYHGAHVRETSLQLVEQHRWYGLDMLHQFAASTSIRKIHKAVRMALLKSRIRRYSRIIGRLMRLYKNVIEVRYVPGGKGYTESLESFKNIRTKRARLE